MILLSGMIHTDYLIVKIEDDKVINVFNVCIDSDENCFVNLTLFLFYCGITFLEAPLSTASLYCVKRISYANTSSTESTF